MHGFACVLQTLNPPVVPALARPVAGCAPALKATSFAGRRGGESMARFPTNDFNCNLYQWREPDI